MKQEKAQHTQGPWSYEMAKEMLRPFDSGIDTGHPESEANARLIAAAPLLLEALIGAQSAIRQALPHLPPDNEAVYCGEWLDEINAAIAATQQ